ncbi:uncharacterized protein LOC113375937 [Ctenocephalides felis]|uniref:uncharacterized protein LOC113375934 n=1 Tax=Ctenocephalides felis TaxID=7515 RepID=UPI000E6E1799|nr:uncharacterized protein LOC113375934 [Ctenocephalides felis]XP_026471658.1 uncharacterized protein LOC113375937 [Ctenocephalides felis]
MMGPSRKFGGHLGLKTSMVKRKASIDRKTWTRETVVFKAFYDSYISARRHAGDEEYTSNEELGRGKRKKKEVVWTSEASYTSYDEDIALYESDCVDTGFNLQYLESNLGTKVRGNVKNKQLMCHYTKI